MLVQKLHSTIILYGVQSMCFNSLGAVGRKKACDPSNQLAVDFMEDLALGASGIVV